MNILSHSLDRKGFAILPGILGAAEVDALVASLCSLHGKPGAKMRDGQLYGGRDVLRLLPHAQAAAQSPNVMAAVREVIGECAFPVRSLFFDKPPGANWPVRWHQDLSIAVARRVETPGFSAWSVKEGVDHTQPPPGVLERMVTVRLHLDDCTEANGALRVIPGSHLRGPVDPAKVAEWVNEAGEHVCEVPRGGVLLMRPLIFHASSRSTAGGHRRVIHIEYAADDLPGELDWRERGK